ncbi:MAG: hypothetical protein EPO68_13395 [Planctomycetota bacterium]|nr:MAG: hypothetical protein EPO68_13395 [Planctomycetota bacterium]
MNASIEPVRDDGGERGRGPLQVLVAGLRRSWLLVGGLVLLGAAVGVAFGLLRPNVYASNAKLLLRVGAREQMTSESLIGLERDVRAAPPSMLDELQMLSDAAILERVARELGPRALLQPADPRRADPPDASALLRAWHGLQALALRAFAPAHDCATTDCAFCTNLAVKALRIGTTVENEPGSNVIRLTTTSTSPEQARAIAAALAEAYIDRHRQQFSLQALVEASRAKLEQAQSDRAAAASAYAEHVDQHGLADLGSEIPGLQSEIRSIESDLFAARVRRTAIARQLDVLAGKPVAAAPALEFAGPTVMVPNEEYETQLLLKRQLLTSKQSLSLENLPKLEAQRRAQLIDAQLATVAEALARTPKTLAQHTAARAPVDDIAASTRVEDLALEDQALAVEADLSTARVAALRIELQRMRADALSSTLRRDDLAAARAAQEIRYARLLERFAALESLGSIDLHEDANLRVLQAPTLELDKLGPKRFSLLLRGVLAGLALGLVLAVLRQHFERRLRDPDSVERALGAPVLAVVPDLASLRRLSNGAVLAESRA